MKITLAPASPVAPVDL